jgi:hypothetical protein
VSAAPSSPGLVPDPSSTSSTPPQQIAARTRLQAGIRKLKVYMDDTFWYGLLSTIDEPNDLSSALSDPHWKAAMESEYSALLCNNTWHLVPPAAGHNLIDCKWDYKIKRKVDGSIDRYKDILFAKGLQTTLRHWLQGYL